MIFYIRGVHIKMDNQWTEWLHQEWKKEYFLKLSDFLKNAYETREIYPPKQQFSLHFIIVIMRISR